MTITPEVAKRFWEKDGSLWSSDPKVIRSIQNSLGWIDVAERIKPQVAELKSFAETVWAEGFTDLVVCGMGGSSLGSIVIRDLFSEGARMHVHVLDSTDPAMIVTLRRALPLESTLFLIASKGGDTIESKSLEEFFWADCKRRLDDHAPQHFVVVTDPGSDLEAQAKERSYRHIFLGDPSVGGRFGVLSCYGLVTMALIGVDIHQVLDEATKLIQEKEIDQNPGFKLGQFFIDALKKGRDKICLLNAPGLESFGLWIELVAESTGKEGKGILPVANEPLLPLDEYKKDRVFVCTRWDDSRGAISAHLTQALKANGHPTFDLPLHNAEEIGAHFLIWEIATAMVAAYLQVNPFNQPNIQSSKDKALSHLEHLKSSGKRYKARDAQLNYVGANGLHEFLEKEPKGTYVAFLGYLPDTETANQEFDRLREEVTQTFGFVTTFGYGPRYLHTTGQYHKGGPSNGVFVLVLARDEHDVDIPGLGVTFGQLKRAQALGDYDALKAAGRKVLKIECRDAGDLTYISV